MKKGYKYSEENRKSYEKYWNSKKDIPSWNKGKKHSKEHINNLIKNHKGTKGMKHSDKTKEKMRLSMLKHIKNIHKKVRPNIGKNEKQILDELELSLNKKITRQYFIKGYFVDGYISELNIVIEVDERPKIRDKDLERENIIKNELNCSFIRIDDY